MKKEPCRFFTSDCLFDEVKCAIFFSQSTITHMESKDFDKRKSVMKTIEIKDYGRFGMSNG